MTADASSLSIVNLSHSFYLLLDCTKEFSAPFILRWPNTILPFAWPNWKCPIYLASGLYSTLPKIAVQPAGMSPQMIYDESHCIGQLVFYCSQWPNTYSLWFILPFQILTQSNYLTFTLYILHFKANILMRSTYRGVSPISLVSKFVFISTFNLQRSTQSCPLIGNVRFYDYYADRLITQLCSVNLMEELISLLRSMFVSFCLVVILWPTHLV